MSDTPPEPQEAPVEAEGATPEPPAAPEATDHPLVVCVGLTDATKQRLLDEVDVDLTDDVDQVSNADVIVASTRAHPDWQSLAHSGTPLLVLCHPGGEEEAALAMGEGASAVIAEGDEAGVGRFLDPEAQEGPIVAAFSHYSAGDAPLPETPKGPVDFGRAIGESAGGTMPTIMLARIDNYGTAQSRAGIETMASVMRRLEIAFSTLAADVPAEPFRLGDHEFALVGPNLDPDQASQIAERFATIVAQFAPGSVELIPAAGVAGPDDAQNPAALWDLAQRAADAAPKAGRTVLDARTLSEVMSADMELEAALRLARQSEEAAGFPPDHGDTTAGWAIRLAQALDVPADQQVLISLAARLRRIGQLGGTTDDEARERTITFVRVTAGMTVSDLLAAAFEPSGSRDLPARILDASFTIADGLAQGSPSPLDDQRFGSDVVEAARRFSGVEVAP